MKKIVSLLVLSLLFLLSLEGTEATTDACKALLLAAETHNEDTLTGQGYEGGSIARALKRDDDSTAECLVAEEIDLNWKDSEGKTTLMYAVEHGAQAVVDALLGAKVLVNTQDNDGRTALHYAVVAGVDGVADSLITYIEQLSPVGSPLPYKDMKNAGGDTPLILAAKMDRQTIATALLGGGTEDDADRNIQNNNGDTALMIATRAGNFDMVRILVESDTGAGANLNVTNRIYNQTALMMAAKAGYSQIVSYLVNHGANLNVRGSYGKAALDFAMQNGHVSVAHFLKDRGAAYRLRGSKMTSA